MTAVYIYFIVGTQRTWSSRSHSEDRAAKIPPTTPGGGGVGNGRVVLHNHFVGVTAQTFVYETSFKIVIVPASYAPETPCAPVK